MKTLLPAADGVDDALHADDIVQTTRIRIGMEQALGNACIPPEQAGNTPIAGYK